MRRILIVTAAVLVAWFVLKDIAYRTWMSGSDASEAASPDYESPDAWLVRPESRPPGGWATPWGVDVLLIVPRPTTPRGPGAAEVSLADTDISALVTGVTTATNGLPLYAPKLVYPSPADGKRLQDSDQARLGADARAAFDVYLDADNRDRGIIVAAPRGYEPVLAPLLEDIRLDVDLRERFGGVFELTSDPDGAGFPTAVCSDAASGDCVVQAGLTRRIAAQQWVMPNLPYTKSTYILDDLEAFSTALKARADLLSAWLDENANKPAEPLGGFETIEIAPVRRPGEETPD